MGSGRTLTDNETKDIIKVIRSLENRRILWGRTTEEAKTKKGGLLSIVFRAVMRVGLPLMKHVFTLLAKSILISLGLTAATTTTDAKDNLHIRNDYNDTLKR